MEESILPARQIAGDPDAVVACSAGDQCRDRKRRRTGAASGRRKGAVGATGKKRRGMCNGWQRWVISTNSTKLEFSEYPLTCSMKLVELGARSIFFEDLEFLELKCLAKKFLE